MKYISLFSGIEAASCAWEPLGWEPQAFSEIDTFPCKLLAERFPNVPNLGDITKIDWKDYAGSIDVVIGGSPCQSFSFAGLRKGLSDPRGNLMLEYLRAVDSIRPTWCLWENVPGVLSADGGRAFGTLLRGLEECGYGFAYRVLDAQFFGVSQRRRRVFVIGHNGGQWQRAAAVLFESESLRGNNKTSRAKREELAAAVGRSTAGGSECLTSWDVQSKRVFTPDSCSPTLSSGTGEGMNIVPSVLQVLQINTTQIMDPAFSKRPGQQLATNEEELSYTLTSADRHALCLASDTVNASIDNDISGTLKCGGSVPMVVEQETLAARKYKDPPIVSNERYIRRLTPLECERLQGFPDGWTDLGNTADSPRYKAIGNSMAVPVIKWLGERITEVEP